MYLSPGKVNNRTDEQRKALEGKLLMNNKSETEYIVILDRFWRSG